MGRIVLLLLALLVVWWLWTKWSAARPEDRQPPLKPPLEPPLEPPLDPPPPQLEADIDAVGMYRRALARQDPAADRGDEVLSGELLPATPEQQQLRLSFQPVERALKDLAREIGQRPEVQIHTTDGGMSASIEIDAGYGSSGYGRQLELSAGPGGSIHVTTRTYWPVTSAAEPADLRSEDHRTYTDPQAAVAAVVRELAALSR